MLPHLGVGLFKTIWSHSIVDSSYLKQLFLFFYKYGKTVPFLKQYST